MALLFEALRVSKRFAGLKALDDVATSVEERTVHGIIGPNGAGKTTFFNIITGLQPADEGELKLQGKSLRGLPTHAVARAGIARTFQNIRVFGGMTVLDNVMVGQHCRTRTHPLSILFGGARARAAEEKATLSGREALAFVGLAGKEDELASNLSYGQRRLLEIARALATEPRLLLLDEPAAGMNAPEKQELLRLIHAIRGRGVTVVLIEHDMKLVMGICDRIMVLDHGQKIAEGAPLEVRQNPKVIEAYLGKEAIEDA